MTGRSLAGILGFVTLVGLCPRAVAQYVNAQVYVDSMWHAEGSDCWESGDEEYTGTVQAKLDQGAWSGWQCFPCTANGNCSSSPAYTVLNQTTLAARLTVEYAAWEDDWDPRCGWESGDDCLYVGTWTFTIRELPRGSWNSYPGYGSGYHTISFRIYWDWIVPPAPILAPADRVTPTSFSASWTGLADYRIAECFLDVSPDPYFTNQVPGFNARSVGVVNQFLVSQLTPGQTYYYRVQATNEAGIGLYSATNAVTLPAQVTIEGITARGVTISLPGEAGRTYQVQRATSLGPEADWQDAGLPVIAPAYGRLQFSVDAEELPTAAFYRLKPVEPQNK